MGAVNDSSVSLGAANINDSGFRPDVDGFSFQNYGEHPDTVDLTAAEMQRMFGGQGLRQPGRRQMHPHLSCRALMNQPYRL